MPHSRTAFLSFSGRRNAALHRRELAVIGATTARTNPDDGISLFRQML